jgi:hypothetical protein
MLKILLVAITLSAFAIPAETVPPEVRKVIDTASGITNRRLVDYYAKSVKMGYGAGTGLSDVKIGRAVHVQELLPDSLKKLGENAPVPSVIKPLDEWAVPLLLNGKVLAMLKVEKTVFNAAWHAGGFGPGWIARQWERVSRIWPVSAGYHPVLIGNLNGQCYVYIPEKGDNNLTPLRRKVSGTGNPDSLYVSLDSSRVALKAVKYRLWARSGSGSLW